MIVVAFLTLVQGEGDFVICRVNQFYYPAILRRSHLDVLVVSMGSVASTQLIEHLGSLGIETNDKHDSDGLKHLSSPQLYQQQTMAKSIFIHGDLLHILDSLWRRDFHGKNLCVSELDSQSQFFYLKNNYFYFKSPSCMENVEWNLYNSEPHVARQLHRSANRCFSFRLASPQLVATATNLRHRIRALSAIHNGQKNFGAVVQLFTIAVALLGSFVRRRNAARTNSTTSTNEHTTRK